MSDADPPRSFEATPPTADELARVRIATQQMTKGQMWGLGILSISAGLLATLQFYGEIDLPAAILFPVMTALGLLGGVIGARPHRLAGAAGGGVFGAAFAALVRWYASWRPGATEVEMLLLVAAAGVPAVCAYVAVKQLYPEPDRDG